MPLRSLALRATTLAAATLTTAVLAALPAAADQPPADSTAQGQQTQQTQQTQQPLPETPPATQKPQTSQVPQEQQAKQEQQANPIVSGGKYRGRVIARGGLYLRDKPTRSSRVIGLARYGSIVHIFCKTRGDNVAGNNRWYLLTDGTWAWGSARYIKNIGAAPRWC